MLRPRLLTLTALALGLVASGCDSTDVAQADASIDDVATVASAFALDSNGALDETAQAAIGAAYAGLRDAGHGGHGFGRPGGGACTSDQTTASGVTTVTVTCERSGPQRSAASQRVATFAYTDAAGAAVADREDAARLAFAVVSGTSTATGPRGTRSVTESTAEYTVTGLDTETLTVNGTSSKAGTYDVTRPDGTRRQSDYTVSMTLTDVTGPSPRRAGPRAFRAAWRQAASGTAEGVYRATVTTTDADGQATTETVERPFTITFPTDREGRAGIRMGGRTHRADAGSGDVG